MASRNNYIILDVETGGLSAQKNPITQFGAIAIDPTSLKELGRTETYIRPYNDLVYDPYALQYTGIRMQDIESGIEVKQFIKNLAAFAKEHSVKGRGGKPIIVGHNVPFDIGFISYAFNFCGDDLFKHFQDNSIDTLCLARLCWMNTMIEGDMKLTLTDCCRRAEVPLINAHSAMGDVEATTDLLRYFIARISSNGVRTSDIGEAGGQRQKSRRAFQF